MTLSERIAENETCAMPGCSFERLPGADFCGSLGNRHCADWMAGRIRRLSDGSYAGDAGPKPTWVARMAQNAKEFSGGRAA